MEFFRNIGIASFWLVLFSIPLGLGLILIAMLVGLGYVLFQLLGYWSIPIDIVIASFMGLSIYGCFEFFKDKK